MTITRFQELKKLITFINADRDDCENPWWKADGMVTKFNLHRRRVFRTSSKMTVDESMSAFRPQTTPLGNLPFLSFIQRKPEDLGTEFKIVADAIIGIMLFIEIQKGKEAMSDAEFVDKMKHKTAACTMRLMVGTSEHARQVVSNSLPDSDTFATSVTASGPETFVGDSWFTSLPTVLGASELGVKYVGILKVYSSRTPKEYIEEVMKDWPAGSHLVLESEIDETKVYCAGYKYCKKKVLTFLFNEGATHSKAGRPYEAKWKREDGSSAVKYVFRPAFASDFFESSNVIDSNNHCRQSILRLEKIWVTRDGYYRIHTTIFGIDVVDTHKTYRHHLSKFHYHKNLGLLEFVAFLAYDLIHSTRTKEALIPNDSFSLQMVEGEVVVHEELVNEPLTQDSGIIDGSSDEDEDGGGKLPAGFYLEENHVLEETDETVIETQVKKVKGNDGRPMRKMYQTQRLRRGVCTYCSRRTSWFCPICPPQDGRLQSWCCNELVNGACTRSSYTCAAKHALQYRNV